MGYRRESNYWYVPLGLTSRLMWINGGRFALNAEYDYFVGGTQRSFLSDAGFVDFLNHQHGGSGARGSFLYEGTDWSFGPWFSYWHITQSDSVCSGFLCVDEPNNRTTEYGLKLVRKIW